VQTSARRLQRHCDVNHPPACLVLARPPPACRLPASTAAGRMLTNEQTNEHTNQQTRRIAIHPGGSDNTSLSIQNKRVRRWHMEQSGLHVDLQVYVQQNTKTSLGLVSTELN